MNDLTVFDYQGRSVRTLTIDGNPWFVGKDVAEVLGYSNPQKAVRDHVDCEDRTVHDSFTVNGTPATLINESGLYSLILTSKLPSAKEFKRWVTSEVLPSIRKTGSYGLPSAYREITTDDYLRAASIVSSCRRGYLPMVLELLKQGGIDIHSEQIKHEVDRNKEKLNRIEAQKRLSKNIDRLYENNLSIYALEAKSGITKVLLYRYWNGTQNPSPERADFLISCIDEILAV